MVAVARKPPAIITILRYFFSRDVAGEGREGWCIPATSAPQDTFSQTMILQDSKTEGDSFTAKYSVPVCFFLSLPASPPLTRHHPPLLLLYAHTLSICLLIRGWQWELREESTQCAAHSRGTVSAHPKSVRQIARERRSLKWPDAL